jgi:geranylgeranyl pyrophosphate synthase
VFARRVLTPGPVVGQALNADKAATADEKKEALVMAEIVEMMHLATQVHDTILEDGDALDKGNPAHSIYGSTSAGNKVSLLAGDFLLSRASVLSASLRNIAIVEAVASALQSMMEGQVQMHRPAEETSFNTYIKNTRRRGGMLLARGCESVALVSGHAPDSPVVSAASEFGLNLGMAYQLLNDLQRTEVWIRVFGLGFRV